MEGKKEDNIFVLSNDIKKKEYTNMSQQIYTYFSMNKQYMEGVQKS